jgi:hypothetical protein
VLHVSDRRGPLLFATAFVFVLAAVVAAFRPWQSSLRDDGPSLSPAATETPVVTLAQDPGMGVSCPIGNDIGCDRVKIAIWLTEPVRHVAASIGDLSFEMGARALADEPLGTFWEGILQPAGLLDGPLRLDPETVTEGRWLGENAPIADVRIEIFVNDENRNVENVAVELRPGYG